MIKIKPKFFYERKNFHKCAYCGYEGSDWPDSDECPNCGEVS